MSKKTLTSLSLKDKLNIIKEVENDKHCKKAICAKYKINISTVHRILKKKFEIIQAIANRADLKQKRNRSGVHVKTENALKIWFDQQRALNSPLRGPDLIKKAKELAVECGENFEPDSNWLFRWKKRNIMRITNPDDDDVRDYCSENNLEAMDSCDNSFVNEVITKQEVLNECTNYPLLSTVDSHQTDMHNDDVAKTTNEDYVMNENQMEFENVDVYKKRDDYDAIAETWANKLRRMDSKQQIWAEKFINDILLEGLLGNLNRHSVQMSVSEGNS
ncbi:uncharacterized protein [Musca autumnalis]|uniref:uncharacterized protein n=1 Tax=Musca autumnalis TaxID=221902 RepID=UPI003CF9A50A